MKRDSSSQNLEFSSSDDSSLHSSTKRRKIASKSISSKKAKEKKKRDHFSDGIKDLSDVLFKASTLIAGVSKDRAKSDSKSVLSMSQTDLIYTAVKEMKELTKQKNKQKDRIAQLKEEVASEDAKLSLLASKTAARSSLGDSATPLFSMRSGPAIPLQLSNALHNNYNILQAKSNPLLVSLSHHHDISGLGQRW
mmetsp:Transcript_30489/g.46502  ORF Transcript_30489/g.46502 Transcript_30489/m.46502 type:complete len:194 (+) Transcript_30489:41-622(+)